MNRADLRRTLLRRLINERFDGVIARFADAADIAPSYVSRMLYPEDKAGAKRIGEDSVDKIETALGIPGYFSGLPDADVPVVHFPARNDDYLRLQHLDAEAGMGDARANPDHPEIIGEQTLAREYIRQVVGFVPRPGRLVLLTGRGDSMLPTIQPGDLLIVDTGITVFDYDGLYLINLGNGQQVKRLVDRGGSLVHVCSDNRLYDPFVMPEDAVIGGKVYLRQRIERLA